MNHVVNKQQLKENKIGIKKVGLIAVFFLFLYPISYNGLSINYSFIFFPIAYLLLLGKAVAPPAIIRFYILVYVSILIVAASYQLNFLPEIGRRLTSFVLFMSMFSFVFVKVDKVMIQAFKIALIFISICFSLFSIVSFVALGGSSLGFEAKDLIGTQRFGFIYLIAIGIMAIEFKITNLPLLIKLSIISVLLLGLLLTFSRASLVSLMTGGFIFFLYGVYKWLRSPNIKMLFHTVSIVFLLVVVFALVVNYVPIVQQFFDERLFSFFLDSDSVQNNLQNENSSEGTRLAIQQMILRYVALNPITGTGYLGVWNISNGFTGSAHNQFSDTLLRTGFPGFAIYLSMLLMTLKVLYKTERGLFWGFVCVMFYGLFHETFKESQGGFVLAFFLGIMSQYPLPLKNIETREV